MAISCVSSSSNSFGVSMCFLIKMVPLQMSSVQHPGLLFYIGVLVPGFMGIVKSHYKDPYEPTSTMERKKAFEHCSVV